MNCKVKSIGFFQFLILFLAFSSCNKDVLITKSEFKVVDELAFPLRDLQNPIPMSCQVLQKPRSDIFSFYDNHSKQIYTFEISETSKFGKEKDSFGYFNPYKKGYQFLQGYKLISEDSLLISINSAYFNWINDSTIYILNRAGKFHAIGGFKGAPLRTRSKISETTKLNKIEVENSNIVSYSGDMRLIYDAKRKATFASMIGFTSVTQFCKNSDPSIHFASGLIPFDGSDFVPLKEIHFEPCNESIFYPLNFKFLRGDQNTKTREVVFGFGNNNKLLVYDSLGKISTHFVQSLILDTIYPYSTYYDEYTDYSRGEFLKIVYDEFNDCYYRLIRVGQNIMNPFEELEPQKYQSKIETYLLQKIDSKFNLISETIVPEVYNNDFMYFVPYRNRLLFYNPTKTAASNKIIFDKVVLEPRNISLDSYKKEVYSIVKGNQEKYKENAFGEYGFAISKREKKDYLIFHMEDGCKNCILWFSMFLKENYRNIDFEKISIILVSDNKKYLLNEQLKMDSFPSSVFVDDLGNYKHFLGNVRNAVLVKFEKGKPKATQFEASTLNDLNTIMSSNYFKK